MTAEHPDSGMPGLERIGRVVALGRIAPGVVHEINNPLFAILGLIELMLAEVEPGTKVHQRLQLMQQSGLEIKEIVRAILDFSRERDDGALVDLVDVVPEAVALFRRTSVTRDMEIDVVCAAGSRPFSGGSTGVKVILLNLLANAEQQLSAAGRGGRVEIAVAPAASQLVLTVSDSGPGVAPELADRIFEPFFSGSGRGTAGLGLAIARDMARSLGGDLVLLSARGEAGGATFELRLPAAAA